MIVHPTAYVHPNSSLAADVEVGAFAVVNEGVVVGKGSKIGAHCILGETGLSVLSSSGLEPTRIGDGALIRSGTIIYTNVQIGDSFESGHRVTIREKSVIGRHVRIGTLSDIQGYCNIADYARLHSNVHIGQGSVVEEFAWIFPYVVLTNDPHPPSNQLLGVTIRRFAVIATSSVILPGVEVGADAVVGALSLVKEDVPAEMLALGNPAKVVCSASRIRNRFDSSKRVYPWRLNFERGMPWEGTGFEAWKKSIEVEE